jgi:hypothetical protein
MLKAEEVLNLVGVALLASGCAETPLELTAAHYVSAGELIAEPGKYNGEIVSAIGFLKLEQHLYLEARPFIGTGEGIVYVRPQFSGDSVSETNALFAECSDELVRVYGRFHAWSSNEAWIDHVYLISTAKHRAPGPEDRTCWTNPEFDP